MAIENQNNWTYLFFCFLFFCIFIQRYHWGVKAQHNQTSLLSTSTVLWCADLKATFTKGARCSLTTMFEPPFLHYSVTDGVCRSKAAGLIHTIIYIKQHILKKNRKKKEREGDRQETDGGGPPTLHGVCIRKCQFSEPANVTLRGTHKKVNY